MTTYAFPAGIKPTRAGLTYLSNTKLHRSVYTSAVQTEARGGELFAMKMTFEDLPPDLRAQLMGYLLRVNGQEHRIAVRDFGYEGRLGVGGGTPLVNGAGQSGYALNVDNLPLSTTGWLLSGDQFQVGNQLCVLSEDVSSNGSGQAQLKFRSALHVSPADNAPIIIQNGSTYPVGTWLLASDTHEFDSANAGPFFAAVSLTLIEDVLA